MLQELANGNKLFAILIDPEDFNLDYAAAILKKLPAYTTHIFVGGSTASASQTQNAVIKIKEIINLPVVLFPGDYTQITAEADALLFLSLLSGDNPEYLIGQHVKSIAYLVKTSLEVIPTGYILIDGGKETTVQRVSNTKPVASHATQQVIDLALAGQFSGKQLIYLEAGSGALHAIPSTLIAAVKNKLQIPLIVGGGIRTENQVKEAYAAGADIVVVGTAFENGTF